MKELRWVQPRWNQRKYELRDGHETLARLELRGWKQVAYIILDEEELVVRSRGFFKTELVISHGDREVAVFNRAGSKKELVFVTGRRFTWQRPSIWSSRHVFRAPDNEVLLTIRGKSRFLRHEAIVEVANSAERYPELRILLGLGWLLLIRAAQGAAAAAS